MNQNIPPVDEASRDRLPDGQRGLVAHVTRAYVSGMRERM